MLDGRLLPVQKLFRARLFRGHGVSLFGLAIFVLVVFPYWHTTALFGFDDLARLNAPQRQLLAWYWHQHALPLWNPFSFAGQPFLAAGQAGPLYLPNLMYLVLPIGAALKLSALLHALLAAYGMYAFVWSVSRSRLGASVAGTVLVTCGFMLGHQVHTQMFDAFAWLPLLVWLVELMLERFTVLRFVGLASAWALEVYAGHPQISLFVCFTAGMFVLLRLIQKPVKSTLIRAFGVSCAFVLGLGLSAAQWLPTLDLTSYSSRAEENSSFILSGSFPGTGLLQFLAPFAAGGGYTDTPFSIAQNVRMYGFASYWEIFCYVGICTLAIAIAVGMFMFRKSPVVRILVVISAMSLLLSLGEYSPMKWLLVNAPGFNLFRIPARYVGITDFSLAALVGIGIGMLNVDRTQSSASLRQTNTLLVMRYGSGVAAGLFGCILVLLRLYGPLSRAPGRAVWVPCVIALTFAFIAIFPHRSGRSFAIGSGLLCMADVSYTALSMWSFPLSSSAGYVPSPTAAFIRQHLSGPYPFVRVAALGDTSLSHDKAAAYGIPAVNGYDSLEPQWYAANIDLTWTADTLLQQPRSELDALDVEYMVTPGLTTDVLPTKTVGRQAERIDLPHLPPGRAAIQLTLKNIDGEQDVYSPLLSVCVRNGTRVLYEQVTGWSTGQYLISLPYDWPRVSKTTIEMQEESWTTPVYVDNVEVYATSQKQPLHIQVGKLMGPKAWLPVYTSGTETVWQNPDALHPAWTTETLSAPEVRAPGSAPRLVDWTPNRQVWRVNSRLPGYFVLSQTYDPNWTALVDSRTVSVRRIDNDLTGVPIGPGTHVITLRYQPESFLRGVIVTGLSLVAVCLLTAYRVFRRWTRVYTKRRPSRTEARWGRP